MTVRAVLLAPGDNPMADRVKKEIERMIADTGGRGIAHDASSPILDKIAIDVIEAASISYGIPKRILMGESK